MAVINVMYNEKKFCNIYKCENTCLKWKENKREIISRTINWNNDKLYALQVPINNRNVYLY